MLTPMTRLLFILVASLSLLEPLSAGGKKQLYLVSFHEEGDEAEGVRKVQQATVNGKTLYFRKQPIITHANFRAYWPFPADDGKTWGAVFWLDTSGQHALQRLGGQRDQYLAAAVNRVPVDFQYIDAAPMDGRIVIWKNLTPELFELMDREKRVRRVGDKTYSEQSSRRKGSSRRSASPVEPGPGAPLPEGAVVGHIDPATLEAVDSELSSRPAKKGNSRPSRQASSNVWDNPEAVPVTEPRRR